MSTDSLDKFLHKINGKENEPIFIIKNWGRVFDPVSINLLNLSNIDRMTTGKTRRFFKKVGSITIYLKEGVKLISLKELFDRYNINKKYRKGIPIHIENQTMTKPHKLLFDPSQSFKIEITKDTLNVSLNKQQYISFFINK